MSLVFTFGDLGVGSAAGLISTLRLLRAVRLLSLLQRFEELKVGLPMCVCERESVIETEAHHGLRAARDATYPRAVM